MLQKHIWHVDNGEHNSCLSCWCKHGLSMVWHACAARWSLLQATRLELTWQL